MQQSLQKNDGSQYNSQDELLSMRSEHYAEALIISGLHHDGILIKNRSLQPMICLYLSTRQLWMKFGGSPRG